MKVFKSKTIMGAALALSIGFASQAALASDDADFSSAVAYGLSSTGNVYQRTLCGGVDFNNGNCDQAWTVIDTWPIKFIQAAGNYFLEVDTSGVIWVRFNGGWYNTGTDTALTSPTQLTGVHSEEPGGGGFSSDVTLYKVSNGVVKKWGGPSNNTWLTVTLPAGSGTPVGVSGDFVQLTTSNGLFNIRHISTGAFVSGNEYAAFTGYVGELPGSLTDLYFGRFIVGSANQLDVRSDFNAVYSGVLSITNLKGIAVASEAAGNLGNDIFMLQAHSGTLDDNFVNYVRETGAQPYRISTVISTGQNHQIAAASEYTAPNGLGVPVGVKSFMWLLRTSGDVYEYQCAPNSCTFKGSAPHASGETFKQIVGTTAWTSVETF